MLPHMNRQRVCLRNRYSKRGMIIQLLHKLFCHDNTFFQFGALPNNKTETAITQISVD